MYKIIGANQAEYGPVSAEQIRQWIGENRVNADTMAQVLGETRWGPLGGFAEFASNFPAASTPPPPPFPPHLQSQTPPPPPPPAPPSFSSGPTGHFGRDYAVNEVSAPAIGLMIVGILGVVYAIFALLGNMTGMTFNTFEQFQSNGFRGPDPRLLHWVQDWGGFFGSLTCLLRLGMGAFILYGGLQMKKLENHTLCVAAAIVAVIPCCCPCVFLNVAIGIWALIVLNRPEIRQHFNG